MAKKTKYAEQTGVTEAVAGFLFFKFCSFVLIGERVLLLSLKDYWQLTLAPPAGRTKQQHSAQCTTRVA